MPLSICPRCCRCLPRVPLPPTQCTLQSLEQAVIDHKVRLIILDSAACLARADFAPGSLPDRQRMLGQQVGAVVCILSAIGAVGLKFDHSSLPDHQRMLLTWQAHLAKGLLVGGEQAELAPAC